MTRRRVTEHFLAACASGNVHSLLELLALDVTVVGDGGGRAKAPLRIIDGASKVARFLIAIAADPATANLQVELMEVNGGPAARLSWREIKGVRLRREGALRVAPPAGLVRMVTDRRRTAPVDQSQRPRGRDVSDVPHISAGLSVELGELGVGGRCQSE